MLFNVNNINDFFDIFEKFLVSCESERHTAENIKKWTTEALESIGITAAAVLGQ